MRARPADRAGAEHRRGAPAAALLPALGRAFEHLSRRALVRLANNEPVDPNDRDAWRTADEHAQAVLRRHGITLNPRHLTLAAIQALTDGQARADTDAGLDWTRITAPASQLDEKLRRAHATLPVDLSDPAVFGDVGPQRRALATRLGLPAGQADDLSRWVLAHPDQFDPSELRCWRIASPTWLRVAGEQLEAVDRVERPVALFVMPAVRGEGWQLTPVLSLDAIRLFVSLGGRLERDLRSAVAAGGRRERARSSGSTCTRCTPGRRNAWTPPDSSRRSSPASSAYPWGPVCRRTSATGGDDCSSPAAPTADPTARRPASSSSRPHVPGAGVRAATSRIRPA